MSLDAHLHVWDRARSTYSWLEGAPEEITGSFSVDDRFAALGHHGIEPAILVQADETLEETAFLLETAAADPRVAGYLPLHDAAGFERGWDLFGDHPCLVGVRNLTHDRADEDWNVRPEVLAGIAAVAERGLPLDYVAVTPRHLAHAPTIAARHPGSRSSSTTSESRRWDPVPAPGRPGARASSGPRNTTTSPPRCAASTARTPRDPLPRTECSSS